MLEALQCLIISMQMNVRSNASRQQGAFLFAVNHLFKLFCHEKFVFEKSLFT